MVVGYLGIILGMGSANERGCCNVMSSLIGWAHSQNDLWFLVWNVDMYDRNFPEIQMFLIAWLQFILNNIFILCHDP